tara:strand:- start:46 stop:243 length:198 start_codon:yes stop_codon:yes gene_type:complete
MKRRDFLKKTGQTLLLTSVASIIGVSCSASDDDGFFDDGYYDDGYYDDGYYDDGYYDDGYYDGGY